MESWVTKNHDQGGQSEESAGDGVWGLKSMQNIKVTKNHDQGGQSEESAGGGVWGLKSTQNTKCYKNDSLNQQISPRRDRNCVNSFRKVKPDGDYYSRRSNKNNTSSKHCYQHTIITRPGESILTKPEAEGLADGKWNYPNQSPAFESTN